MPDWLKEALTGESLFKGAAEMWNACVTTAYALLGASPTDGQYSSIWNSVTTLYDFMLIIGSSLMILFFVYGFCRDNIDIKANFDFEHITKMFFRLFLANGILLGAMNLIPTFFSSATILAKQTQSSMVPIDVQALVDGFGDLYVIGFVIAIIFWLFCIGAGVLLIFSIGSRFLKLYMIIPLAPIALSTIAGGGGVSQTAVSWIKTFLAYTFSIVVMGIALMVSGAFVSATTFFDIGQGFSGGCLAFLDIIVKLGIVVASVKGAEATLQKAMGL